MKKLSFITLLVIIPFAWISPTFAFTIIASTSTPTTVNDLQVGYLGSLNMYDFSLLSTALSSVASGAFTSSTTIKDIVYNTSTNAQVTYSCALSVLNNTSQPIYKAVTPSIASIDQAGNTTYISNGMALFDVTVGPRTRQIACPFSYDNGSPANNYYGISPLSLTYGIIASTTPIFTGRATSTSVVALYSSTDDTNHVYVRNPNLYGGTITTSTLTSIPVYNSQTGTNFSGVLVATDTLIFANHAHPSRGASIYFVTPTSGTVIETVEGGMQIGGSDIYVATMTPITTGITPAKVLAQGSLPDFLRIKPDGTRISFSLNEYHQGLPAFYTDQFRELHLGTAINFTIDEYNLYMISTNPWYQWYRKVVNGDSGSPSFLMINGKLVTLGTFYGAGTPSNISSEESAINAAMVTLGSHYQLTEADLSGFTSF